MQEFMLIIAGGRDFTNFSLLEQTVLYLANGPLNDKAISIVSGMAPGADTMGYTFAVKHNVLTYQFPADWITYGKRAGMLRNKEMGLFADGLLAFWDGQSKGTKQMIDYMQKLGKPVHVIPY